MLNIPYNTAIFIIQRNKFKWPQQSLISWPYFQLSCTFKLGANFSLFCNSPFNIFFMCLHCTQMKPSEKFTADNVTGMLFDVLGSVPFECVQCNCSMFFFFSTQFNHACSTMYIVHPISTADPPYC